jgi:hypothetical protein
MKAARSLKTNRTIKKFVLRLPVDIHEKISVTAQKHRRSMNAEITYLIHAHLTQQIPAPTTSLPNHEEMRDEHTFLTIFKTLPEPTQMAVIALLTSIND